MKFKAGDVVAFAASGVRMTVESVDTANGQVTCSYLVDGKTARGTFALWQISKST